MRTLVRTVAISSVAVVLVGLSGPAQASHDYDGMVPTDNYGFLCWSHDSAWDESLEVCRTDNRNWYWYADSGEPGELEANDLDALRTMLLNEFVPTDLSLTHETDPVFSGSGETDVIFQEAESDLTMPATLGMTWCNDYVNGTLHECDQTYVRIHSPDGYRRHGGSIACHEAGHAVGLVHGNDASPWQDPGAAWLGCMVNEDEFPSDLGSDSTHLINVTY